MQGDPVSAAVACARALGLRVDEPIVLREAWHVLVHLAPAPVVARVTSGAPGVDPDDVERELRVAVHAAARGAPVIEPTGLVDPGPHELNGRTIVFWRYVEQRGDLDPSAAGRGLRALHEALDDYGGELPRGGRADDVVSMLADVPSSPDVELLIELSARELPVGQALHGDAHLYNCMPGVDGPVWHDLETACRGPCEYDLAALVHANASTVTIRSPPPPCALTATMTPTCSTRRCRSTARGSRRRGWSRCRGAPSSPTAWNGSSHT